MSRLFLFVKRVDTYFEKVYNLGNEIGVEMMFRKPENIFKSYIVQYVLLLLLEFIVLYNVISPKFMVDYESMQAMMVMIPLFFFVMKSISFTFAYIFFQMTIYNQLKNMKESFLQYKKQMTCLYLASIMIPVIVLLKNSVDFQSLAFLTSFYLLYIYVVIGFVSLLIIRALFYSEENDMLGHVGWLTLFFLGIIGIDILPILKMSFITIVTIVLFVFSLFLLQNQLALPLKFQKRLEAGSVWQVSVSFKKKKIFQNMLTFYDVVEKKEMDTRCDFFQNSQVLLSSSSKDISTEQFTQLCQNNYYMIIDVPVYEEFVVGNENQFPNVIIVAIKMDEYVDGRETLPVEFEDIMSDFYKRALTTVAGLEKLLNKKKKKKKRRKNNAT